MHPRSSMCPEREWPRLGAPRWNPRRRPIRPGAARVPPTEPSNSIKKHFDASGAGGRQSRSFPTHASGSGILRHATFRASCTAATSGGDSAASRRSVSTANSFQLTIRPSVLIAASRTCSSGSCAARRTAGMADGIANCPATSSRIASVPGAARSRYATMVSSAEPPRSFVRLACAAETNAGSPDTTASRSTVTAEASPSCPRT